MKEEHSYQLELEGARFYEKYFVPAIFRNWANVTLGKLDLNENHSLLDVACGTGIVARQAKALGVKSDYIVGLDINPGMLQVASEIEPDLTWKHSASENLPFSDMTFDRVVCQFGIMFFQNKPIALNEMIRVKKAEGQILVSSWDKIENNEGYYDLLHLVDDVAGMELGEILKAPFNFGEVNDIQNAIQASQAVNFNLQSIKSQVKFSSIKDWVDCDIKASPIGKLITEDQYEALVAEGETKLSKYLSRDGTVRFDMSAHVVSIY